MFGTFIQTAIVLFREGLEAMLVIVALAGHLRKVDDGRRVPLLYAGTVLGIGASIALAFVFEPVYGARNNLFESLLLLGAAALMLYVSLYVSGWLYARRGTNAWQTYLKTKTADALSREAGYGIMLLAFLVVFREGAETNLFLYAVASAAGGWTIELFTGVIVATFALVVFLFLITKAVRRLPLRLMFMVTSAILFVIAVRFIGEALQSLQDQQYLSHTVIGNSDWLTLVGFNPTWEAITAQLAVVALSIATVTRLAQHRHRAEAI